VTCKVHARLMPLGVPSFTLSLFFNFKQSMARRIPEVSLETLQKALIELAKTSHRVVRKRHPEGYLRGA
jgi:hypothetical protein